SHFVPKCADSSTWHAGVYGLCWPLGRCKFPCLNQRDKLLELLRERWWAMSFKWDRVHVWSCEITDQPGSVASKLAFLAQADANLEYIFTKRLPHKPGYGVLNV